MRLRMEKRETKRRSQRTREQRRERYENFKAEQELNLPNIPDEIVVEILSRLVRFMCVSNQWCSYVKTIVSKKLSQKVLVLSDQRHFLDKNSFSLQTIDREGPIECVQKPTRFRIKSSSDYCRFQLLGSCNGLLLIGFDKNLFLWNPLTNYCKKVPSCRQIWTMWYRNNNRVSGLCYDSIVNEYKAVMALPADVVNPNYGAEYVMVGSLKRKLWAQVRFPYEVPSVESGPVVNGHLHWFASKELSNHFHSTNRIIYFVPHMNKFKKVPMPKPKQWNGDILLGLGVLQGSLCMVRHTNPQASFEVLVMKEYGVKKSWTIMFNISNLPEFHAHAPYYQLLVPLFSTKNGEALLKIDTDLGNRKIMAYNFNDDSHTEIISPGPFEHEFINAVVYEESLVQPNGYNWEKEAYVEYSLSGSPKKWKKKSNHYWDLVELEYEEYEEWKSWCRTQKSR